MALSFDPINIFFVSISSFCYHVTLKLLQYNKAEGRSVQRITVLLYKERPQKQSHNSLIIQVLSRAASIGVYGIYFPFLTCLDCWPRLFKLAEILNLLEMLLADSWRCRTHVLRSIESPFLYRVPPFYDLLRPEKEAGVVFCASQVFCCKSGGGLVSR